MAARITERWDCTSNSNLSDKTCGWDDGKYYCLFSEAPSGTILKIKNQTSQKFIYAKVLDVIPDVQQNEDILVRLSNSAAAELAAEGEKFQVEINYQKN